MTYRLSPHDRFVIQRALDNNDVSELRVLLAIDSVRGRRPTPEQLEDYRLEEKERELERRSRDVWL